MPKVKDGKKYERISEEQLHKALQAVEDGMSIRKAAIMFGVKRSTIQFRRSNKFRNKTTFGPRPILTEPEEKSLETWIINCHKKGFPLREYDVRISVKHFLDENPRANPFPQNFPQDGWMKGFLKRHPKITFRTPEGITSASSVVSETNIRKWFTEIETYLKEKGFYGILQDPSRIFNGDETCFLLCPKNKRVLAPKGSKNVYEIQHHPKKNLTVMFTFSAAGVITPPMIIYAQSRITEKIRESVPDDWGIGCSENGWMKNELFYEYIGNVLYPFMRDSGTKFPVILFIDGHCTHLTYQISELCNKLQIILISLYPNTTRIMQPADVSAFKPLKNGWRAGVVKFQNENPGGIVSKENFAKILKNVVDTTLPSKTIKNGFRACGLYPWDPSAPDYSKCTGKEYDAIKKPIKGFITLDEFKRFTGKRFESLQTFCEDSSQSPNEEFTILYEIFKEMNKMSDVTEEPSAKGNEIKSIKNKENYIETATREEEDDREVIEKEENRKNSQEIDKNERENVIDKGGFESCDYDLSTLDPEVAEACQRFDIENIPMITQDQLQIQFINEPSTSNIASETDLDLISSKTVDIGSYFTWPATPERQGKRITQKLPFVLTSSARKKIEQEKIENKKQEEALKEKRKEERLKKKEEKIEKNLMKGRQKKVNSKSLKTSVAKKTGKQKKNTTQKSTPRIDSKENIPNEVIPEKLNVLEPNISNVSNLDVNQIESSPDRSFVFEAEQAKRKLFTSNAEEDDSAKKIRVLSTVILNCSETEESKSSGKLNAVVEENERDLFGKNEYRTIGLCFVCVRNMTKTNIGLKCYTCQRTYHLECAVKQNESRESDIYRCKTCLKY